MKLFESKSIKTLDHMFLGQSWSNHWCEVIMNEGGFTCNCQKAPRFKCNHIKSVELGILGVNCKEYAI